VLLANLTGELMGGSDAPSDTVEPGTPVSLAIPAEATGLTVTKPDGSTIELARQGTESHALSFSETDLPGIYVVRPLPRPGISPTVSAPGPNGVGGSRSGSAAAVEPLASERFAVDLFDVDESTIAPGSAAAIEALGRVQASSPGASGGTGPGAGPATTRPTARDELWIPIVLIVLVALCAEWAVYQRDALVRVRRGLASRLGRQPADRGT